MTNLTTVTADVRAGDREREAAARQLGRALTQGYLDLAEYEDRIGKAFAAHTAAELRPLLADLPAGRLRRNDPARRAARRSAAQLSVRIHFAAYLAMVVVVLTVWLVVALTAGAWYFWPVWPILGAGIGVLGHAVPIRLAHGTPRQPGRSVGLP
jgi:fatty acid desaturase